MAIRFEATGDFSDLIRENQKFQKQLTALQAALRDVTGAAGPMGKDAVKAYKDIERAAQQAKKSIESPAEAMAATQKKYDAALKAGLLTQEEHAAAMGKLGQKYSEHGGKTESLTSKLLNLGAGYMSFQTILGQVQQALKFVNDETDRATNSLKGLQPAEGQLAQIATSTDDLAAMSAEADRMAAAYGVKREDTRAAIVEGRNLAIEAPQLESMVKYSDVAATSAQTLLGGKMQAIFGKDKVNAQEAVSMGLVAAGASASNFEEMARGIPSAAEGGRMAGASAEETLALYSVFAGQFGTAATGAERIKALGAKISKSEQLKGLGFTGAMEKMATMAPEELFGGEGTVFGADTESKVAYETLKAQMPAFRDMTAKVAAEKTTMRAGGESFIESQYAAKFDESRAKTDVGKSYVRTQLALEENRRRVIAEEIANERQFGVSGVARETAIAEEKARQKRAGYVGLAQYGGEAAGKLATSLGLDAGIAGGAQRAGTEMVGGKSAGGFVGRRLLGAATFGMSDIHAGIISLLGGGGREQPAGGSADRAIELLERNARATEDLRDASRTTPRPGASAAAAAGSRQRLGR